MSDDNDDNDSDVRPWGSKKDDEPQEKRSFWRELAIIIGIVLLISWVGQTFLFRQYVVPSESMESTLIGCAGCSNDRIVIDKLVYRFGDPKPGDVVSEARQRFRLAKEAFQENRALAIADTQFVMGDSDNGWQWPEDIRNSRKLDKRVCLTVNMTAQHCNQIINNIRMNRPAVKISPAYDSADKKTAEILGGLIRNIQAASASGWRLPAPWRWIPRSCCLTNRPAPSTRKWSARCWT